MIHVHLESVGVVSIRVISAEKFFEVDAEFSDSITEKTANSGISPVIGKHFPVVDEVNSVIKDSVLA